MYDVKRVFNHWLSLAYSRLFPTFLLIWSTSSSRGRNFLFLVYVLYICNKHCYCTKKKKLPMSFIVEKYWKLKSEWWTFWQGFKKNVNYYILFFLIFVTFFFEMSLWLFILCMNWINSHIFLFRNTLHSIIHYDS